MKTTGKYQRDLANRFKIPTYQAQHEDSNFESCMHIEVILEVHTLLIQLRWMTVCTFLVSADSAPPPT